jgi:hypothetical protein
MSEVCPTALEWTTFRKMDVIFKSMIQVDENYHDHGSD